MEEPEENIFKGIVARTVTYDLKELVERDSEGARGARDPSRRRCGRWGR
jgi:hypothetical protein